MNRIHFYFAAISLGLLCFELSSLSSERLVISEVMPENRTSLADEDGEYSDWAEIMNAGDSLISLADHFLSDDPLDSRKWRFPGLSLAPGESVIIFCSGKDRRTMGGGESEIDIHPETIPGLLMWLDAQDSSMVISEGERVTFWLDKSGQGNSAIQVDRSKRPAYGLYSPTQLPLLQFDGEDDFLNFPEQQGVRTLFWVGFESPLASDNFRPMIGHDRFFDFHRGDDQSLFAFKHTVPINEGATRIDGHAVDPWKTRFPAGLSLLEVESSKRLRANLLASDRHLVDRTWHGGIGEVLLFDRRLSADERNLVQRYLLAKWQLPNTYLHTNFRLKSGSETLALYDPQSNLIDSILIPELKADVSIGRSGDGSKDSVVYSTPTPGSENVSNHFLGVLPEPVMSLPAGGYAQAIVLSVSESKPGASVHYTADGSSPAADSTVFPSDLVVHETTTLRVASFQDGYLSSKIQTLSYLISESSTLPQIALTTDPINLFSEERGVYIKGDVASTQLPHFGANFWREWERPVSVELFAAEGELLLSQNAGLKVHGGWSRAAPQKSLALIARNRYGDNRFRYPVFSEKPIGEFKQWLLRNSGNDWVRTLFRDALGHHIANEIGLDCQAYQPVHIYLNGRYWGIHNLRERLNEHFIASNHSVSSSEIDMLEGQRNVIVGEVDSFDELLAYLRDGDPKGESFQDDIESMMDVSNFFDYIAIQIYIDNTDWPENNIRYWKSRKPEGRWNWIPFDLDGGFDIQHTGPDRNLLSDIIGTRNQSFRPAWIRYIVQRLLQNSDFEQRFIQRFQDLLNTTFSAGAVLTKAEKLERRLAPEIDRHVERWGGGSSSLDFVSFDSKAQWLEYTDVVKTFAVSRPAIVREHLKEVFGLGMEYELELVLPEASEGSVRVNGLPLERSAPSWRGKYFDGASLLVEAVPASGFRFVAWADAPLEGGSRNVVVSSNQRFEPVFSVDTDALGRDLIVHPLQEKPFVFQSFFPDSEQKPVSKSIGFLGRSGPDSLVPWRDLATWLNGFGDGAGSRFRPLGGAGVSFLNTAQAQPGVDPGFVDSVLVAVDTVGVDSGTVSWTVSSLSPADRNFGVQILYRLNLDDEFVEFANVPENELLYSTSGNAGSEKRFQEIPLPVEMLGHSRVEIRWVYYQLDGNSGGSIRPEIRLDDIVIAAQGQSAGMLDGDIVINELLYHPESRDPRDEYIELYNRGAVPVDLSGWRLSGGVDFEFNGAVLLPNEYVLVVADRIRFSDRFPETGSVVGDWSGKLSNRAETINLFNARQERVDRVNYADEGDWSVRVRGVDERGHQGWTWSDSHDGMGRSLELVAPSLSNNQGMNWNASREPWGTPGRVNSNWVSNGAPLLSDPTHSPALPRSVDPVTIRIQVRDEDRGSVSVNLVYRVGSDGAFQTEPMWDDGRHGDGSGGDGLFAGQILPQTDLSVVSFFVEAMDALGNVNTWPRFESESIVSAPMALYQVDDQVYPTDRPLLRVITSEEERDELSRIGMLPWNKSSDAQMNATFISQQGAEIKVHYLAGLRLRGSTSRLGTPKNRRVNFRSDDPWKGKGAVILNAVNVPSQIIGSMLFRSAGVPSATARPVQFLENGQNHARPDGGQFGHYAEIEALDGSFVSRQFPADSNGNLYRPSGNGNLEYLGENPIPYQAPGFYRKGTNEEVNDWSDLIELTRRIEQSSDAQFVAMLDRVADIDRWVSYFAVDALLANTETSFANGGAGDYALYITERDRKAYLIAYDLDSLWVPNMDALTLPLFRAASNSVGNRFLKHPEIARRYHRRLRELAMTVFDPVVLGFNLDQALGGWVSKSEIERLKRFAVDRREFVLGASQIPFKIELNRPFAEPAWLRYFLETSDSLSLTGTVDPLLTDTLLVNGVLANMEPWAGRWSVSGVPLHSGVNQVTVQAVVEGQLEDLQVFNVFRPGNGQIVSNGTLTEDTLWKANQSPIVVNQPLLVPEGLTLTIEAGTSVEFNKGAGLTVEGRLLALGTSSERIFLSRNGTETQRWGGIQFAGAERTNQLHHVTIEWTISPTIKTMDSTVSMIGLRWSGAFDSYILSQNSSLLLKDSLVPNAIGGEFINGSGVPDGGFWILEGNEFGTTASGGDIVDFSGGRRPDTMLQIIDNVFHGGPDDGLDLDGADALVDGNVFMNFRKANSGTGDAHAISTGLYEGRISDLTIVRNLFVDNEHALLMKEGAVALVENNTFVRSLLGTVNFAEVQRGTFPPDDLVMRQNIIWNSPLFRNLDVAQSLNPNLKPSVENSLVFPSVAGVPDGNLLLDPLFMNPIFDFRLRPESPAIGVGKDGVDLGAFIGAGVRIAGEPSLITSRRSALLTVSGIAISEYRYRVNNGEYGLATAIDQPIRLDNLTVGPYRVDVIGRNIAGRWQETSMASESRTWFVNPSLPGIRINEVLARSGSTEPGVLSSDYVELHNEGDRPFDLSRAQLSDDLAVPNKFVFPQNTIVDPGDYVLVFADGGLGGSGFHAAFRIDGDGGGIYLRERFSQGQEMLDSIEFGRQLQDLSLSRTPAGSWALGNPSPSVENDLVPLGESHLVRINEWLASPIGDEADFVELYNQGSFPVDLGGMALTPEPSLAWRGAPFPPLSFIGGQEFYAVFADNGSALSAGSLGFRLSNEQGMIGLLASSGEVLDQVAYGYQLPGVSLERDPPGSPLIRANSGPSPGRSIASIAPGIGLVLSEVVADNREDPGVDAAFPDWVEIHNRSDRTIRLEGFSLTDDLERADRWVFPPDLEMTPDEYLVVPFDSIHPAGPENTGFGLKSDGGAVYLFELSGAQRVLVDSVEFGLQAPDWSIGRIPEGDAWTLGLTSPGLPNVSVPLGDPMTLRINEWMAQPDQGDDWFEIYNAGDEPVALDGLFLTDDPLTIDRHAVAPLSFIGTGLFGYQVFEADGQPGQGGSHVDFKLSAKGESVGIYSVAGVLIDEVRFGIQQRGVSEGRLPDGGPDIVAFPDRSTRDRENFLDRDLDGILDTWELEFGLDSDLREDGLEDFDSDGVLNYGEFLAGTDPLDPESLFVIHQVSVGVDGFGISFQAEEGQSYLIEVTNDLVSGTWQEARKIKRLTQSLEITLSFGEMEGFSYYRVITQ
ncbi:CotH kinase family protein [Verrucomicrobia bacterium]|nr:CotH kinase family protein [Verrucomicrobiota bacterium]